MKTPYIIGIILYLSACSPGSDAVRFITTSNIGINTDADTATASVGYDRQELIIAPVNPETGGIHPLYADIQQDRSLIKPRIQQVFATGTAAKIIALGKDANQTEIDEQSTNNANTGTTTDAGNENNSPQRVLVFGTTSSIGLKLSASAGRPELQLGYKRKEHAKIPVVSNHDGGHKQVPSLFGSLRVGVDATVDGKPESAPFELNQIIATGAAAENAVSTPRVRQAVEDKITARVKEDICGDNQARDDNGNCIANQKSTQGQTGTATAIQ